MRLNALSTTTVMTIKELLRNRVAMMLVFVVPGLFYSMIILTTPNRLISFQLATIHGEMLQEVNERHESLVFIGLAAMCLLTGFVALHLLQKHSDVNRRVILAGLRPSELILSKLFVLLGVITVVSGYLVALLVALYEPRHLLSLIIGFMAGGYVYGCYGLLVGSIFKRELEGILGVVLLANTDPAWLQNPIYYMTAQNQAVIRLLPGFYPEQAVMTAAFTDHSMILSLLGSFFYGTCIMCVALVIYRLKMRIYRT